MTGVQTCALPICSINDGRSRGKTSAVLVQVASQYESRVHLVTGDKKINAKSIMGMMSMNFANGSEITIVADGSDEKEAVDAIEAYLGKDNQ